MKSRAISPESVIEDPKNRSLTIPRTYGVYEIFRSSTKGTGRKYRYGNYPVRLNELEREYGKVALIALFLERNDSKEYAEGLNYNR